MENGIIRVTKGIKVTFLYATSTIIIVLLLRKPVLLYYRRLQRFEKTNEMLSNCNTLSATRLERAMRDFKGHTAQVLDMKKDLDHVLKRIHNLKQKLMKENPDAFKGNETNVANLLSKS